MRKKLRQSLPAVTVLCLLAGAFPGTDHGPLSVLASASNPQKKDDQKDRPPKQPAVVVKEDKKRPPERQSHSKDDKNQGGRH